MQKTLIFNKNTPKIISCSTICGPKEATGPLGKYMQHKIYDDTFGEDTYEKAECKMQSYIINDLLTKNNLTDKDIDALISGDLLNQIISASFSSRNFKIPFIGVYNACSTITEAMAISSAMIDSGYMNNIICTTSSHFSTAERQYRYPLELGCTRPPQAQWTVTGAGSYLIANCGKDYPKITMATFGKVIDYGVIDANNMGCAMAPSAMDTLITHFKNTNTSENDYDYIITGDLGVLGSKIFTELVKQKGYNIKNKHKDCGAMIYKKEENEFQGGSGAGCGALVFANYFYPKLINKEISKILFIATGALLSTVSSQQGESIPSISHLIAVES